MELERFDALVIGAGQAGVPLATAMARAGRETVLIEREHVGGTCINKGCTPTKTMVASAEMGYLARRTQDYGVSTGDVKVDMEAVRQRKREIVSSFRQSTRERLENAEVTLLIGHASFVELGVVEVTLNEGGKRRLTADDIFINTGARPRVIDIGGLDEIEHLNSTTIMELGSLPEHLLIVGGGYVGVEFSQMFRRFGSSVTVVQRSTQLLTHEDPDIAGAVLEILRQDGIEVFLASEPVQVEPRHGGIHMVITTPDGERSVDATHLLLAAGRVPNTDELNPEAMGLELDERGHIVVNDRLETNIPRVYAMGDVKGGPAFTHISYDDYRVLRTNLIEGGDAKIADRIVPYTVFIDPQLGRAGLTEEQARKDGREIKVAQMPMKQVARAIEIDRSRGLMKAVVDAGSGRILGCAVLGVQGGEIAAMIQIAMMGGLPYTALRDGIFTHPTLAESLNTLFAQID